MPAQLWAGPTYLKRRLMMIRLHLSMASREPGHSRDKFGGWGRSGKRQAWEGQQ